MKPGKSREIISGNIKEMVKAGHKPKQAIAAALSHARKTANMDEGGLLEQAADWIDKKSGNSSDDDSKKKVNVDKPSSSSSQSGSTTNDTGAKKMGSAWQAAGFANGGLIGEEPKEYRGLFDLMAQGDQGDVASPKQEDIERSLARKIQEDDDSMYMAMGGLVEDGPEGDEPVGNKPSESMMSGSAEPMSEEDGDMAEESHAAVDGIPHAMGLSKETMDVIMEKKKKRRYM